MENKEYRKEINSPDETRNLAERLASRLVAGDIITLTGDLGAGKTTFTQGLAKGLGVNRNVNSPTFTIIKEYQGLNFPLYHMDAYRLEDQYEDLGLDEYFYGQGICVIEWPQMIEEQLPVQRLDITILKSGDEDRVFQFTPLGRRYDELVKDVLT
jgi:tRNA threonylcarbamoyladenosine biosynthesis protein TsaE